MGCFGWGGGEKVCVEEVYVLFPSLRYAGIPCVLCWH